MKKQDYPLFSFTVLLNFFFLQCIFLLFLVDYQISCLSIATKVRSTTIIQHILPDCKVLAFIRSIFQWKVIQYIMSLNNN